MPDTLTRPPRRPRIETPEAEIRECLYRNAGGIEVSVTKVGTDRSGDLWWAEHRNDQGATSGFLVTATALAVCGYLPVDEPAEQATTREMAVTGA